MNPEENNQNQMNQPNAETVGGTQAPVSPTSSSPVNATSQVPVASTGQPQPTLTNQVEAGLEKPKKKKTLLVILGIVVGLFIIGTVALMLVINSFFKSNKELVGEWKGGGGYFVFNDNGTYYWYQGVQKQDQNYYYGTYVMTKKALTNADGFKDVDGMILTPMYLVQNGAKKEFKTPTQFVFYSNDYKTSIKVENLNTQNYYNLERVK